MRLERERWSLRTFTIIMWFPTPVMTTLLLFSKKCEIHFLFNSPKAPSVRTWTGCVKKNVSAMFNFISKCSQLYCQVSFMLSQVSFMLWYAAPPLYVWKHNTVMRRGFVRRYPDRSADAAVCALAVGQGFVVWSQLMLSGTVLEVVAHIMHRLIESLGNERDERVEREREREKWGTLGS